MFSPAGIPQVLWTGNTQLYGQQGAGLANILSIANLHVNYHILSPGQATIAYIAHIANLYINCDIKLLGRQGPGLATIACIAYTGNALFVMLKTPLVLCFEHISLPCFNNIACYVLKHKHSKRICLKHSS